MKLVAIHQPNFFPWLGYFDKIRRADVFVVLDDVQHQKTGGTWSNRVKLNIGGTARWATAPTVRNYHGVRQVREIEFDETVPWRDKLLKTLEASYGRSPCFTEGMNLLKPLVLNPESRMWAYNMHAIRALFGVLIEPAARLVLASELGAEGSGTDLLVALVRAAGGDGYLSGGGAGGYQDPGRFAQAGVRLVLQDFHHPVYLQHGVNSFIPGLSVIDALLNCGLDGTRRLLRGAGA